MKKLLVLAIASLIVTAQPAKAAEDTGQAPAVQTAQRDADYDARIEAAKSYLRVNSVRNMLDLMLENIRKNPQMNLSPAFWDGVKDSIDYDALDDIAAKALAKTFTLDEINAMVVFYGSPAGQSIMKKMPAYMAEVTPAVQEQMMKSVAKQIQKMQAKAGKESAPARQPASHQEGK
ncbi:MAG: DUF2059 domain-containing protein [Alphaproteobacteria bacterium]|nr:DUF2059 domain-containing protein [Alphaproteobacteria bacterium]